MRDAGAISVSSRDRVGPKYQKTHFDMLVSKWVSSDDCVSQNQKQNILQCDPFQHEEDGCAHAKHVFLFSSGINQVKQRNRQFQMPVQKLAFPASFLG
jgi:hypothetical protein